MIWSLGLSQFSLSLQLPLNSTNDFKRGQKWPTYIQRLNSNPRRMLKIHLFNVNLASKYDLATCIYANRRNCCNFLFVTLRVTFFICVFKLEHDLYHCTVTLSTSLCLFTKESEREGERNRRNWEIMSQRKKCTWTCNHNNNIQKKVLLKNEQTLFIFWRCFDRVIELQEWKKDLIVNTEVL